jgi:hypothetical protein
VPLVRKHADRFVDVFCRKIVLPETRVDTGAAPEGSVEVDCEAMAILGRCTLQCLLDDRDRLVLIEKTNSRMVQRRRRRCGLAVGIVLRLDLDHGLRATNAQQCLAPRGVDLSALA